MMQNFNFAVLITYLVCVASASFGKVEKRVDTRSHGYDCGWAYFSDDAVKFATEAFIHRSSSSIFPEKLNTHLFGENPKYVIWPIVENGILYDAQKVAPGDFRIVVDQQNNTIDVIALLSDNSYARCQWKNNLAIEKLETDLDATEGYRCGDKFLSDDFIEANAHFAHLNRGKSLSFPLSYHGNLYSPSLGYVIWPISDGEFDRPASAVDLIRPEYIVLNRDGQVVDTIVRLASKGFIKCYRINESSEEISYLQPEQKSHPRATYKCGNQLFTELELEYYANFAKEDSKNKIRKKYPKVYKESKNEPESLVYPLLGGNGTYASGQAGNIFLKLSMSFKVLGALTWTSDAMRPCPIMLGAKETGLSEIDDFICGNEKFSHKQLLRTARVACEHIGHPQQVYPCLYNGYKFDVPGPYLRWPLFRDTIFTKSRHFYSTLNSFILYISSFANNQYRSRQKLDYYKFRMPDCRCSHSDKYTPESKV